VNTPRHITDSSDVEISISTLAVKISGMSVATLTTAVSGSFVLSSHRKTTTKYFWYSASFCKDFSMSPFDTPRNAQFCVFRQQRQSLAPFLETSRNGH
jgi:hypothetical protein